MRAAARCLDAVNGGVAFLLQQVAAGDRHAGQDASRGGKVARPDRPPREIAQQFRPGLFAVAQHQRIGVPGRLLRQQCRVHTAQHHGVPPRSQFVGNLVGPRGRARDGRYADQIGLETQVQWLHALILDRDLGLQFRRHQGSQRRQG